MEDYDIISRQNAKAVHMRRLSRGSDYRRQHGEFMCEGGTLLCEALDEGAQIPILFHDESADKALLSRAVTKAKQSFFVPAAILEYVSGVNTPLGFVFSVKMPCYSPLDPHGRYLILDGVSDPGNMGAIIRSADAFLLDAVILTGNCTDVFAPKAVRASAGAIFRMNAYLCDRDLLKELLFGLDVPLYGAVLEDGALDISQLSAPCAVVVGNEANGVSQQARMLCDAFVKIPMSGRTQSLNASVAAGIISYCIGRK